MLLFMIFATSFSQPRFPGKSFATRSEVIAQEMEWLVEPLATEAAIDILKQGEMLLMQQWRS